MVMIEATRRRHEHVQLQDHVRQLRLAAREIPALSPEERRALVTRIVDFLHGTLARHAREEEWGLYPEIARLLGNPRSTATMARDHEAIRERVAALDVVNPADGAELQELLYGLYALISVHLWKEEVEYLPLLEESGRA
jgi:iron-sulfur cluster repair protein YtfE (RIC family)